MIDVLLVRPGYFKKSEEYGQNKLFEEYIYLARKYLKNKIGFEGTEGLHISVGLSYIAAKLEQMKIKTKILDFYIMKYLQDEIKTIDDAIKILKDFIRKESPKIIGIECMYSRTQNESLKMAQAVKEISDIPVIMGGSHATFFDLHIVNNPYVDYVIRREAELAFFELVKNILQNKKVDKVKGITYKNKNGIRRNPEIERISNLDSLPFPARYLYDMNKLYALNNKTDFVISSRGCKYNCAFCTSKGFWQNQINFRSMGNVLSEISKMVENYGTRHICFFDENFGLRSDLREISKRIAKEQPNIDWAIETRLDLLNKLDLKTLGKSNCNLIYFGFESFCDTALIKINKAFSSKMSLEKLKLAKDCGIKSVMGTFIVGLPGETVKSFIKTVNITEKLVKKGIIDICYFLPLMPFPGTDIFKNPQKFGINVLTKNFDRYYYILDDPIALETEDMKSYEIKKMMNYALERMIKVTKEKMVREGIEL